MVGPPQHCSLHGMTPGQCTQEGHPAAGSAHCTQAAWHDAWSVHTRDIPMLCAPAALRQTIS